MDYGKSNSIFIVLGNGVSEVYTALILPLGSECSGNIKFFKIQNKGAVLVF